MLKIQVPVGENDGEKGGPAVLTKGEMNLRYRNRDLYSCFWLWGDHSEVRPPSVVLLLCSELSLESGEGRHA